MESKLPYWASVNIAFLDQTICAYELEQQLNKLVKNICQKNTTNKNTLKI